MQSINKQRKASRNNAYGQSSRVGCLKALTIKVGELVRFPMYGKSPPLSESNPLRRHQKFNVAIDLSAVLAQ